MTPASYSVFRLPFSVVLLLAAAAHAAPVTVQEGELHGRPVIRLDNGLVRLSVTPEIGGRVLELTLLADGGQVANPRLDNIGKKPTDRWEGAEYGGLTDAATTGWPGPFWAQTYALSVEDGPEPGAKTLVAVCTNEGLAIRRAMTVFPDSTAVRFALRQTHVGKGPRKMNLRLHAELAAGKLADNDDALFIPESNGVERIDVTIGAEYERFRWIRSVAPWMGVVDTAERTGYLRFLEPRQDTYKLFYWVGFNESPNLLGDKGAFFALDWFGDDQVAQPGESIEAEETFVLVSGLESVEAATPDWGVEVRLDRPRYGSNDTLRVTLLRAGATALPSAGATCEVMQGDRILQTGTLRLPATPAAGQAASAAWSWPLPDLPDGAYRVRARLEDGSNVTAEKAFAVVGALAGQAVRAVLDYRVEADALRNRLAALNTEAARAEAEVLALRMRDLDERLVASDYEAVLADAPVYHEELALIREWTDPGR